MFELLRVQVLRFLKFCLGTLEGGLDCALINFFFIDRMFRENTDLVALDLGKAAGDCEKLSLAVFSYPQLSVFHLGEQRNVSGKDSNLALDGRNHDCVDRVRIDASFRSDDFESQRHGEKRLKD